MKAEARGTSRKLRQKGVSVRDIAHRLNVSPSTVSRWCKDISLTSKQQEALISRQREASLAALKPFILRNRELKRADIETQARLGRNDVGSVSHRDLYMLGLGLYWGEGYKRGSQECGFTNSDPSIIRIILRWFNECYGIERHRISARLTLNDLYRNEENRILRTWSKETGIPESSFSKTTFINGYGKLQRNPETYQGTLRIKVRNGTSLRRRILSGIGAVEG